MRIALQELLAGKDPEVWRLSADFLARLDRFYADIIAKDDNRVFVAVDREDRPVAMLMVRIITSAQMLVSRFGRIDDAWVEPSWRARGVMTALTRAACRFLADRGVSLVMLDWANNNEPSGTCWQRIGFKPLMTMGFAGPAAILDRPGKE
ncbi:GNAT family N-acetyltransferase [candidate division WOR-3 bacterium]|nr:GNAT family N-acetyltransferase [candidate division WOR-3 bacterium]